MNALRKEKPKRKGKLRRYRHWPIVMIAVAFGLLGARHISGFGLPTYPQEYAGPVIYPILVALKSPILLLVAIVLLSIGFIGVVRGYKGIARAVISVGLVMFCGYLSACTVMTEGAWWDRAENRATTFYEGHSYTVLEYHRFSYDGSYDAYLLYRCDSLSILCQLEDRLWSPGYWGFDAPLTNEISFQINNDGNLQLVIGETIIDIPTE